MPATKFISPKQTVAAAAQQLQRRQELIHAIEQQQQRQTSRRPAVTSSTKVAVVSPKKRHVPNISKRGQVPMGSNPTVTSAMNGRGRISSDQGDNLVIETAPTKRRKTSTSSLSSSLGETDHHNHVVDGSNLRLISDIPLTLWASYLSPSDVLTCIQTCKSWKNKIDKEYVWHEVAKGLSSITVGTIEKAANMSIVPSDQQQQQRQQPNMNYRNVALALANKKVLPCDFAADFKDIKDSLPRSKLGLDDIFLVMEVWKKGKKKLVSTGCTDLSSFSAVNHHGIRHLSLSPENTNSVLNKCGSIDAFDDYAFDEVEISTRFIRRDNGMSVCLNDKEQIEDVGPNIVDGKKIIDIMFEWKYLKPKALTHAGSIAREMFYVCDYKDVHFHFGVELEFGFFELNVKSCYVDLTVGSSDEYHEDTTNFKEVNHLLLFLEGLEWK